MQWGGATAERLGKAFEDRGLDLPEHLARPDVLDGYEEFLAAFWHLNSDRQIGFGVGPIPFSAIHRYADRALIETEEFWLLHDLVRAMDGVFLEHHAKKAKDGSK